MTFGNTFTAVKFVPCQLLHTDENCICFCRRQLSRESLLRSLSRSKTGSRDSLDRWVENGVRTRNMWRKVAEDDEGHGKSSSGRENQPHHHPHHHHPHSTQNNSQQQQQQHMYAVPHSGDKSKQLQQQGKKIISQENNMNRDKQLIKSPPLPSSNSRPDLRKPNGKGYRELDDTERFPGLDKDTARVTLHSSNLNLSQHIYSEPSFDTPPAPASKSKRFSFAFWK